MEEMLLFSMLSSIIGSVVSVMDSQYNKIDDRAYNGEMVDKANAYNSTPQQFDRMLQAGISPSAAAMGLSKAAPAVSPVAGNSEAHLNEAANLLQGLLGNNDRIYNSMLKDAEINKLKNEGNLLGEQTIEQQIKNMFLPYMQSFSLRKLFYDGSISEETFKACEENNRLLSQVNDTNLAILQMQLPLIISNIYENFTQGELNEQKIEESEQMIEESEARINEIGQNIKTGQALERLYNAEAAVSEDTHDAQVTAANAYAADAQKRFDMFSKTNLPVEAYPLYNFVYENMEQQMKAGKTPEQAQARALGLLKDLSNISGTANEYVTKMAIDQAWGTLGPDAIGSFTRGLGTGVGVYTGAKLGFKPPTHITGFTPRY